MISVIKNFRHFHWKAIIPPALEELSLRTNLVILFLCVQLSWAHDVYRIQSHLLSVLRSSSVWPQDRFSDVIPHQSTPCHQSARWWTSFSCPQPLQILIALPGGLVPSFCVWQPPRQPSDPTQILSSEADLLWSQWNFSFRPCKGEVLATCS